MLLKFKKLSKYYLESCALKEATGDILLGEKVLVQGENGSGKSTFLKLISGQSLPSGGEILLEGAPLKNTSRGRFSILGESRFIYLDLTLKENLKLSLHSADERLLAETLCQEFDLDFSSPKTIRELSSGQKQKVAAIRALASKSDILVFDEPLNFLDPSSKSKFTQRLCATDKTVVLVSHESEFFPEFRKVEIKKGVLC